ncbi:MAG TPA: helix-hairpin-helix domain-containing protein [Anaerolineales bacterium]|nr:helix-hairpin-helix domain-containing protein [Anaerolineales bacterium]
MRAFKVFIFGLLYGWFFKIAFDRIYRENDREDLQNENQSLRQYIHSLERQVRSTSQEPARAAQLDLQAEPKAAPLPEPTGTSLPATTSEKDDLKVIKGIGPAIERKLNNAGIHTFAALSQLSPKQLEEILGSQIRRLQDENDVIMQAVRLAQNSPDTE